MAAGHARILRGPELRTAEGALPATYGNRFRSFTIVTLVGRPRKLGGRAVGVGISLDPLKIIYSSTISERAQLPSVRARAARDCKKQRLWHR